MWLVSGFDWSLIGADVYTGDSSLRLSGDQGTCRDDGTGGVAGKWKLAGNHHFLCLWFSTRHCHLLRECTHLKDNVRILLQRENQIRLVVQSEPRVSSGEDKSFCEEANKNICVPSDKYQQVG